MEELYKKLDEVLTKVEAKVFKNYDAYKLTWFKTGGKADYFIIPKTLQDLVYLLENKPDGIPIFILGLGSNVIIRDKGFKGIIISLRNFTSIKLVNESVISAEVGVASKILALFAKDNNTAGFEFLYNIPGSIGGALKMNAGAYLKEIKDIFLEAKVINLKGKVYNLKKEDIIFNYRSIETKEEVIFLEATFKGEASSKEIIAKRLEEIEEKRKNSQPQKVKTGGSTFANPKGFKAWELIDKIGYRGLKKNGAYFSDIHCNFLINDGSAKAKDLEDLGEEVRSKVKEKFDIDLKWEVKIIGEK